MLARSEILAITSPDVSIALIIRLHRMSAWSFASAVSTLSKIALMRSKCFDPSFGWQQARQRIRLPLVSAILLDKLF